MPIVTIDEAALSLKKLVQLAEAGEDVTITREGLPVVQIVASCPIKQDFPSLADLRAQLPYQSESAGDFIRRMRDEDRY
ncbi:MAG: hypothetical protein JO142_08400 [Burkholderiales bacterium]|nr:hypothetical protein [Burkholderiales bacterium]